MSIRDFFLKKNKKKNIFTVSPVRSSFKYMQTNQKPWSDL